jgi:Domain of unknown function (DUF4279)
MTQSNISTSFTLTGFSCEPENISRALGLEPTKTWKTGDLIGKSILKFKHNGWFLEVKLTHSIDLEEHVQCLLEILSPAWDKLVEFGKIYDAEFNCVIYSYEAQGPGIHLNKQMLNRMAQLNAEFDVDYYSLATNI